MLAESLNNLGMLARVSGRSAEAEERLREALAIDRQASRGTTIR